MDGFELDADELIVVAGGAGSLMQHAADEPVSALDRLPEGERVTNGLGRTGAADPAPPPGGKPGWIKFRASNDRGWVWQDPAWFHADKDGWFFRRMEPTDLYPRGYVRFENGQVQGLNLEGRPGSRPDSHFGLDSDGGYPIPKDW